MKQLLKSWPLRLNLLSVLAVAAAVALQDRPWLTVGLALAVFGVGAWRYRDDVATLRSARALTAFALLVTVWYDGGLDRWPLLLAGAGMMLFITAADLVARALNVGYLQTYNLNIVRGRRERWTSPPAIARMMNVLSVLYALAAMPAGRFGFATDLAFMVIAGAAFGWTSLAVLRNYLHRRTVSHPVDIQVLSAVRRLQPKFVIHFAGTRESEYQLTMWLDYFTAVGDPYLIIIRDQYLVDGIASRTDAPIVVVPAQSVLDTLLPESVRACYYVNHAVKNAQLVKLDKYLHVQLMHGDSDKAISRSPVSLMYDRVFVAGQAGIDRYHRHGVDIPNYKFRKIGRPQLHDLQVGPRDKREGDRRTVLYTPTWTGLTADVNYSSLKQGKKIVRALLKRDVNIIFRTHPYTRTNAAYHALAEDIKGIIAADAAASGRAHRWGERAESAMSLSDCINAADVAISDISGTASDWLYCGRPFAMTDPKGFKERYLEEFPLAKAAYLLDPDAGNIERVLDELLERDSKADLRAATREYYLGDIKPGDLVDLFKAEVKATYEQPVRKIATGGSALLAA
ncbi:CDP-glycerol glycerophosphotransferase family protein [Glycomyces sp. TRM65418]|uniref:CDP-glycerol glycerophosphotransferase family protein n=1 Tax=Glycomyces sp. TRM65418 TaxID=2867006 RepID=UPI001CE4C682|nr:CDP-glycerol glycerophosphotransferase family protein [Glycomyces sp. TRM65418]MCC3762777.1 CDP-glycerol glycerophosphotransferase family protein [Glycomyces sp. TRM65418]QZD56807.1 CDP-glycerol glycerophosphotransferase family protein [Glycomyces sp. TRM65418]